MYKVDLFSELIQCWHI